MTSEPATTRLAPSPTGALHLGNARTFLVNWLMARQRGWRILMRVEDLDGPRVKPAATLLMLEELEWLGLTWDEPVVYQSQRAEHYRAALDRLIAIGAAYPCTCSRRDMASAGGAPHADDGAEVYPGTCRGKYASAREAAEKSGRPVCWRVRVNDRPITFRDEFAGEQSFNLAAACGDFVIFKGDGLAAYQLAVVVDDAAGGVDAVVRGDDLLESAARQIHLRRMLGSKGGVVASCAATLTPVEKGTFNFSRTCPPGRATTARKVESPLFPEPLYWHLPLVVGPDGRRLAKRHGDTRLSHYRHRGTTPERILGLLGFWCGLLDRRRESSLDELARRFDLARLPRDRIVFSPADDRFLMGA